MYQKIKSVLSTHTVRQSSITVVATFVTSGLGALFYLLLARALGSEEYGLFSLSLTIFSIVVTIADAGMAQGIIRFVGASSRSTSYFPYASLALWTKLLIGAVCLVGFVFLGGPIATMGFHQSALIPLMPIIGVAIASQLLISFSLSVFQALQKFVVWGAIQIGSNLVRLCVLFLLWFGFSKLSALLALGLHSGAILGGFLLSWAWLDPRIISAKFNRAHLLDYWSFNKWTASFMALSSLTSRLDTLFVARYLSLTDVGVYALSAIMVAFIPQLSSAIGAVTSAKFASLQSSRDAGQYLTKSTLFSGGIGLLVSLLMIPVALFVINFTGRDYGASFTPFLIQLLAFSIFTLTNPVRDSILYFYHKPQFFLAVTLGQALVIAILCMWLIPTLGITGAAISVLGGHALVGVASFLYYQHLAQA